MGYLTTINDAVREGFAVPQGDGTSLLFQPTLGKFYTLVQVDIDLFHVYPGERASGSAVFTGCFVDCMRVITEVTDFPRNMPLEVPFQYGESRFKRFWRLLLFFIIVATALVTLNTWLAEAEPGIMDMLGPGEYWQAGIILTLVEIAVLMSSVVAVKILILSRQRRVQY